MAGYVPGLVAETEEDKKTGILDRIAGGINKAYSDPARARGLTQMGMALMDAAGPRPLGQQLNTGQILARGFAGYQQGKDAFQQQQLAQQVAEMRRAENALKMAKLQGDMAGQTDPYLSAFGDSLEGRQMAALARQYAEKNGATPQAAVNAIVNWRQSQPKTVTTQDAVYNVPVQLPFGQDAQQPASQPQDATAPAPQSGPQEVIKKQRDVPQGVIDGLSANRAQLDRIDESLSLLGQFGETVGWQNNLPLSDLYYQYSAPEATKLRGALAAIENMQIKDVSGATVTAAEDKRLAPYIPKLTDTPDVVREKLTMFKKQLEGINAGYSEYYSEENGFRPLPASLVSKPQQEKADVKRYDPVTGEFK